MPFRWLWHKLFPHREARRRSLIARTRGRERTPSNPSDPVPLRPRTPTRRPRKGRWPVQLYRVHKGKPQRCNFIEAIRYALDVHDQSRLRRRQLEDSAADFESIKKVMSKLQAHRRNAEAKVEDHNLGEMQALDKQILALERVHKKQKTNLKISHITAGRVDASKTVAEDDLLDAIEELLERRLSHIDGIPFNEDLRRGLWQVVAPREYFEELQRLKPLVQYLRSVQDPHHDSAIVELALIVAHIDELENMRPTIQDPEQNRERMVQELYRMIRQTLLGNGLVDDLYSAAHADKALYGGWKARAEQLADEDPDPTAVNHSSGDTTVVIDPFEDYKLTRYAVTLERAKHDNPDHDLEEVYDAFFADHHDATEEQWSHHWLQHRTNIAQDLGKLRAAFYDDRDLALRLGAEPLEVENDGDWDLPEFDGVHPQDGDVDSEAADVKEARRVRGVQLEPSVVRWAEFGVYDVEEIEASIDIPELDLSGIHEAEIGPWESCSSCERRTLKGKILRRHQGSLEERATKDELSLMTGQVPS